MKKFLLLTLLALLINGIAFSQAEGINNVIPPSPQAAGLGKYVEVPVSMYTGIPNISIPLHQISAGDLSLPISVSYHSSGVKVEEIPGSVGLGWSLNAGGVITRSIVGMPDEEGKVSNTILRNDIPVDDINNWLDANTSKPTMLDQVGKTIDLEPDIFYFNFSGYSGKFVLRNDWTAMIIPKQPIEISADWDNNTWTIKTPDGKIYTFGGTDAVCYTENKSSCGSLDIYEQKISSWYLTSIQSPNKNNNINFIYEDYMQGFSGGLRYRVQGSESQVFHMSGEAYNNLSSCENLYSIRDKRIQEINSSSGDVLEFKYSTRDSLQIQLDTLKLLYYNKEIRRFDFKYDSFPNIEADKIERLRLLSIQEKKGSEEIPAYTFEYNTTQLPPRLSFAQDYWGYYNGAHSNESLLPKTIIENDAYSMSCDGTKYSNFNLQVSDLFNPKKYCIDYIGSNNFREVELSDGEIDTVYIIPSINSMLDEIPGANRETDSTYLKAGILTKINYPSGGYTKFEYEQNTIGYLNSTEFNSPEYNTLFPSVKVPQGGGPEMTETFTVGCAQLVKIEYEFESKINPNRHYYYDSCSYVELSGDNGFSPIKYVFRKESVEENSAKFTLNDEELLYLQPGTYTIKSRPNIFFHPDLQYTCTDKAKISTSYKIVNGVATAKDVGGLRINKITINDGESDANNIVKEYLYSMNNDGTGRSSGVLLSVPEYARFHYPQYSILKYTDVIDGKPLINISSSSQMPLGTTQGSHIGYRNVIVKQAGNGISVHTFKSAFEYSDKNVEDYPFRTIGRYPYCHTPSFDYKRGALEQQEHYSESETRKKKVQNSYNMVSPILLNEPLEGYEGDCGEKLPCLKVTKVNAGGGERTMLGYYNYITDWSYPIDDLVSTYDDNGDLIMQELSTYAYDNPVHMQQTRATKTVNGKTITSLTLYPDDYANGNDTIEEMKDAHIINKPVETVTYQSKGGNTEILSGEIYKYKAGSHVGLLEKIYKLETSEPISKANYTFSNMQGADKMPFENKDKTRPFSLETIDGNYNIIPKVTVSYDADGNKTQIQEAYSIPVSYIYGYYNNLPIIKAVGMEYADLETLVSSTLADARLSYANIDALLTSVDKLTTDAQKAKWELFNTILRSNLQEEKIVTITYIPLVGATSETNEQGITTYYYYDGLGRLETVKDNDGNVLKHMKYNYAK